jgi:hypothetical protein
MSRKQPQPARIILCLALSTATMVDLCLALEEIENIEGDLR